MGVTESWAGCGGPLEAPFGESKLQASGKQPPDSYDGSSRQKARHDHVKAHPYYHTCYKPTTWLGPFQKGHEKRCAMKPRRLHEQEAVCVHKRRSWKYSEQNPSIWSLRCEEMCVYKKGVFVAGLHIFSEELCFPFRWHIFSGLGMRCLCRTYARHTTVR